MRTSLQRHSTQVCTHEAQDLQEITHHRTDSLSLFFNLENVWPDGSGPSQGCDVP